MLDAASAMRRFTVGKSRPALDDEVLFWALVAQLAIFGEAASRVSDATRASYPRIPWRAIVGTRNQLVHGYWSVDPDQLWQTVSRDLPVLIAALQDVAEP